MNIYTDLMKASGSQYLGNAGHAFRRYAQLGFDRRALTVFEAYEAISGCCRSRESTLDMLAVYDTLRLLCESGREDCVCAVYEVYFSAERRALCRNDLSYRVRRHAYETSCDERTVYRRLRRAAELYGFLRRNSERFITQRRPTTYR